MTRSNDLLAKIPKMIQDSYKSDDYGIYLESKEMKVAINCEQEFEIGSNTKMFTAATILKLIEDLKLKLTDTLAQIYQTDHVILSHLKNWNQNDYSTLTIKDLICHRGLLPDMVNFKSATDEVLELDDLYKIIQENVFYQKFDLEAIIVQTKKLQPNRYVNLENVVLQANEDNYSNTGYWILGDIIQRVTNLDLEQAYKMYIFDKLKMTHTSCKTLPHLGKLTPEITIKDIDWSYYFSAGGVVSTAFDMSKWIHACKQQNHAVLSKETWMLWYRLMSCENKFGVGLINFNTLAKSHNFMGHAGQTLGFNSIALFDEKHDIELVIWSNQAVKSVTTILSDLYKDE